jgi:fructose-1,6-bisphosphatase/inositol monophosphatase family enzyme
MSMPGSASLHSRVIAAMTEVAGAVIVPRFNKLKKEDIRAKTHAADYVTIADEEAEQRLIPILRGLLPHSRVVGEEGASADIGIFDAFAGHDPVWVIDPIDGTANFVNGVARFAVMLALVKRGETVMGWIHEPLAARTLFAEKGAGAWQVNVAGEVTRQSIPKEPFALKDMVVALHHKAFAPLRGRFARNVRLGSAAHDYWALSEGRIQVLSYRRLKPWDHAAGALIHAESGGYNRLLEDRPYRPAVLDEEGLLCAPSRTVWDSVVAMLNEDRKKSA